MIPNKTENSGLIQEQQRCRFRALSLHIRGIGDRVGGSPQMYAQMVISTPTETSLGRAAPYLANSTPSTMATMTWVMNIQAAVPMSSARRPTRSTRAIAMKVASTFTAQAQHVVSHAQPCVCALRAPPGLSQAELTGYTG